MSAPVVRNLPWGSGKRDITEEDVDKLIKKDSKLLVDTARAFGQYIAKHLSSSHIRNIYGEVKQMEMTEFAFHRFILLKPKLQYAAKRDGSAAARDLAALLTAAIDAVGDNEDHFKRFADFFEAILAYHKAYGGK